MGPLTPRRLHTLLLAWFDQHGRKHLPWQKNKTPYRVWVSEIMLQQTQVNTVIPYFQRFMRQFPSLTALAHAHQDEVLHLWAGLGYYSRARYLHQAAKMVRDQFHGKFPDSLDKLQQLPGIGPSTAGAILSIAFNQTATILDGNVKRVLTRLCGIQDAINEKTTENKLWEIAKHYTPRTRHGDYTQAIMDLGATLCTRGQAQCHLCPLATYCQAYQLDIVAQLPKKKVARRIPTREATFLVVKNGEHILLNKRPSSGIWGGLFSLPEIPGLASKKAVQQYCEQQLQLTLHDYQPLPAFRHTFSHYHLDIHPVLVTIKPTRLKCVAEEQQIWYNPNTPKSVGLPVPVQLIIRDLL